VDREISTVKKAVKKTAARVNRAADKKLKALKAPAKKVAAKKAPAKKAAAKKAAAKKAAPSKKPLARRVR
jgi:hypothetical protein